MQRKVNIVLHKVGSKSTFQPLETKLLLMSGWPFMDHCYLSDNHVRVSVLYL